MPGLNQVQVNTKAGLTFASCLRSILRQDPNVIMIGEIRDKETAEIAMKAAQTGHLVLSTLHTNDSISAVTRLLDLGVPGFQIATSLTAIIAQRLIRRLCACHKSSSDHARNTRRSWCWPESLTRRHSTMRPTAANFATSLVSRAASASTKCSPWTMPIRAAIRDGGRNDEIRTLARHNGMRLMQEYALEHVRDGLTTLEEVQRVVPFASVDTVSCASCRRELSAAFYFARTAEKSARARKPGNLQGRSASR